MADNIRNIRLHFNDSTGDDFRASLHCECNGARYHFHLADARTGQLQGATYWNGPKLAQHPFGNLYKNPLRVDARPSDPDYFRTMTLRTDRGIGARIVPTMLAMLPALLPDAIEARRARIAQENTERLQRRRALLIKEHAADLYETLRLVAPILEGANAKCTQDSAMIERVRAVLEACEVKE